MQTASSGKPLAYLSPDTILNYGYALHVSRDPTVARGDKALARKLRKEFLALKAVDQDEAVFLGKIQAIALSHGGGLTRRKQGYLNSVRAAEEEYKRLTQRVRDNRVVSIALGIALRLLPIAALGTLGFTIAQALIPFIPDEIGSATGTRAPSIVAALFFAAIGRWISTAWEDFRRTRIVSKYHFQRQAAEIYYEAGKLEEYIRHRSELCLAWKEYTGEEYPKTDCFKLVIKSDLDMRRRISKQMRAYSVSEARVLWQFILRILRLRRHNGS